MTTHLHSIVLTGVLSSAVLAYPPPPRAPCGMTHERHVAQQKEEEMKRRGAAAMGFDQDAVIHRFLLTPGGGTIEVETRNPSDIANRRAIRAHLGQIAAAFSKGNFDAPSATHAEVPPGVAVLQARASAITYAFEQTSAGGRVLIATADEDARSAVHEFLRYQIQEHHTADPLTVR